ncbi:DUF1304 domain-containing protein [Gynuella sp.]|uniref:DUF1304 domain-containing protein n=1 Tax=Gynuella sp. TaxID=2969146 RepID=UPI003D1072F3
MTIAISVLIVLIALQHVLFLLVEMFLWDKPFGRKMFGLQEQFARDTKALAANQGLYNGFLAAGLFWSLVAGSPIATSLSVFFLGCVAVAGVFGGLTANIRIIWVQALPALVTLLLIWLQP